LLILTFSGFLFGFHHFFFLETLFCIFFPSFSCARNTVKHPENAAPSLRNSDRRICDDPPILKKTCLFDVFGVVITDAIAAHKKASQPPKHPQTTRKIDLRFRTSSGSRQLWG